MYENLKNWLTEISLKADDEYEYLKQKSEVKANIFKKGIDKLLDEMKKIIDTVYNTGWDVAEEANRAARNAKRATAEEL